eukprot:2456889-Alexandrium_andersonii.AAC.1
MGKQARPPRSTAAVAMNGPVAVPIFNGQAERASPQCSRQVLLPLLALSASSGTERALRDGRQEAADDPPPGAPA